MSKSSTNKPNKPLCYVALMRENRNKQCQQKTERQKTHHEVQTISQSAMSKRYTSPNPSRFSVSKQTNRFQALPPLFQPTNARKQSNEDISLLPHSPLLLTNPLPKPPQPPNPPHPTPLLPLFDTLLLFPHLAPPNSPHKPPQPILHPLPLHRPLPRDQRGGNGGLLTG